MQQRTLDTRRKVSLLLCLALLVSMFSGLGTTAYASEGTNNGMAILTSSTTTPPALIITEVVDNYGGSIKPVASEPFKLEWGDSLEFSFEPDEGYALVLVEVDGVEPDGHEMFRRTSKTEVYDKCKIAFNDSTTDDSDTYTITSNDYSNNPLCLKATFEETDIHYCTITAKTQDAGTGRNAKGFISPMGDVKVPEGTDAVFTVWAIDGCVLEYVEVNGTKVKLSDDGQYTIPNVKNVKKDQTIIAKFSDKYEKVDCDSKMDDDIKKDENDGGYSFTSCSPAALTVTPKSPIGGKTDVCFTLNFDELLRMGIRR